MPIALLGATLALVLQDAPLATQSSTAKQCFKLVSLLGFRSIAQTLTNFTFVLLPNGFIFSLRSCVGGHPAIQRVQSTSGCAGICRGQRAQPSPEAHVRGILQGLSQPAKVCWETTVVFAAWVDLFLSREQSRPACLGFDSSPVGD